MIASPHSLIQSGIAAIQQGNMALARAHLSQAIHNNPHNPHAWASLARTGLPGDAYHYCMHMAVELDPNAVEGMSYEAGPARRPSCLDRPGVGDFTAPQRWSAASVGVTTLLDPTPTPPAAQAGELSPAAKKEIARIAHHLENNPELLGRWIGYGARLAEEV